MAWQLKDGYWVNTETGQKLENKGATGDRRGGDGFKTNNLFKLGVTESGSLRPLIEQYLNYGVLPDKNKSSVLGYKDFLSFLKNNDLLDDEGNPLSGDTLNAKLNPEAPLTSTQDLLAFDTQGSTGNQLYNTFLQSLEEQYAAQSRESQIMERDLNKQIAGERQSLLDQIRNERRQMLKSGLSQSAIANREIQGLLQGQQIASEYGEQFLTERRNLNANYAMRDSLARQSALEAAGSGFGNVFGALKAAGAADMTEQAKYLMQGSSIFKSNYNDLLKNK